MPVATTRTLPLSHDVIINAVVTSPNKETSVPILVFLHYWGGSSKTWQSVINQLSEDYPTVAIDLRGWGDSQGPDEEDAYTISQMSGDVEAVISTLQLDNYVLVGISMGAKISQLIGGRRPTGLSSIILVSPAPPTPFQLDPSMRDQQIHAYDSRDSAMFVTSQVLTASNPPLEVISELVTDQLRGNKWAKKAWPAYGMGEDILLYAKAINVPVLILAAEKDVVETLERVKRKVYGEIPHSQIKVIEGSGHLSPVDCPLEIAKEIREFI